MEEKERLNCDLKGLFKIPAGLVREKRHTQEYHTNFKNREKTLQVARKNNYLKLKRNEITWHFSFLTVELGRTNSKIETAEGKSSTTQTSYTHGRCERSVCRNLRIQRAHHPLPHLRKGLEKGL